MLGTIRKLWSGLALRPPPAPPDADILGRWSAPGLRRNCLDRKGKKMHLRSAYGIVDADAEKILDEMFGPPAPDWEIIVEGQRYTAR